MISPFSIAILLAQTTNPAQEITSKLDSCEASHFNGFIYVEVDRKPVYFHTVGYANRAKKKPFTLDGGLEIGSIVKPFSKIVLMNLAAAGKLSLDDPLSKYFPHAPADKSALTLKMVMDHKSGLDDTFGGDYDLMTRQGIIDAVMKSKLIDEPGKAFHYSNSGYSLLAIVEEMVTGKSFESYVRDNEFLKVGMKRTGYLIPHWSPDDLAMGYNQDGSEWGTPLSHEWLKDGPGWNLRGNGGMISTIHELANWGWQVHNGGLMKPEVYAQFVPAFNKPNLAKGAIWAVAGGNGIFDTVVAYNPSRKLVIVAFSSDARFQIETVLREMRPTIFKLGD